MKFGDCVEAMRGGMRVFRPEWDRQRGVEPGAFLKMGERQDPTVRGGSSETIELFVVGSASGSPFFSSKSPALVEADVLAEDWELRQ